MPLDILPRLLVEAYMGQVESFCSMGWAPSSGGPRGMCWRQVRYPPGPPSFGSRSVGFTGQLTNVHQCSFLSSFCLYRVMSSNLDLFVIIRKTLPAFCCGVAPPVAKTAVRNLPLNLLLNSCLNTICCKVAKSLAPIALDLWAFNCIEMMPVTTYDTLPNVCWIRRWSSIHLAPHVS